MKTRINRMYIAPTLIINVSLISAGCLLIAMIAYGELLIFGYFGPIAFGLMFPISLAVILATWMIGFIVKSLAGLTEECEKISGWARILTGASLIFQVLAILQVILILLLGIWRLLGPLFR